MAKRKKTREAKTSWALVDWDPSSSRLERESICSGEVNVGDPNKELSALFDAIQKDWQCEINNHISDQGSEVGDLCVVLVWEYKGKFGVTRVRLDADVETTYTILPYDKALPLKD